MLLFNHSIEFSGCQLINSRKIFAKNDAEIERILIECILFKLLYSATIMRKILWLAVFWLMFTIFRVCVLFNP